MMRFSLFVLFIISTTTQALAQDWKRTQNWYFGDSAGLSFATDPPTVLTDGQMYALEGSATISDTAGNLLFYTNGQTVWNKNHQVMKNGTGLLSNQTYAQAALIVPQPGNDSIYFIFTTGHLYYSVVNINGDGGNGEITEKNLFLVASGTEKLAATHHANGHDVWVVTHGGNNNNYYAYLVTKDGVINCPIISSVGAVMTSGTNQTEMRFSSSGQKACTSFWNGGFIELLRFNNDKGRFSDPIRITTSPAWVPGIIFSPDETQLLVSARNNWIRCYNINDFNESAINSRYFNVYIGGDAYSQFQYSSTNSNEVFLNWIGKDYLGKVSFSATDTTVMFIDSAIAINPATGLYGMPQFISSYYYQPNLDIQYQTNCENDSVSFLAKSVINLVSPAWTVFKQGNTLHTANGQSLNYSFFDTGAYTIRLVDQGDTVEKEILIEPHIDLGGDTFYCGINEVSLSVPEHLRCLQWQNGSDSSVFKVNQSGTYYVSGYDTKGCLISDTVKIKMGNIPVQPPLNKTGDSLYTDTGYYAYQWYLNNNSIGVNAPFHIAKQTGNYEVKITDSIGCTSLSSEFTITVLSVNASEKSEIRVYPNPLSTEQVLYIESEKPIHTIRVFNSLGQLVHDETGIETDTYQLKNLNRGIYTLVINQIQYVKIITH